MVSQEPRIPDVYGPGTYTDAAFLPVPQDTERIFRLLASQTPGFTQDESILSKVQFEGDPRPVLPGPIKAPSVAAALHAMVGVVADEILTLRGLENKGRKISINTTHTALWFASVAAVFVDGIDAPTLSALGRMKSILTPDWEHGWTNTPMKFRGTAIYPTKREGVWYCVHGSMAVPKMLRSLGIDPDRPEIETTDQAAEYIASHTRKMLPEELEMKNMWNGNCGSVCFTPKQWTETSMGKALDKHPLVNVREIPTHSSAPPPIVPFPQLEPSDRRPLAGIRVLELTRIIAGPQVGAYLASLGADVIRVSAPHLPDLNMTQLTFNAGKRTIALDLRKQEDLTYLQSLVEDADIFLQGFRFGKMKGFGLGVEDLSAMAARRGRGIVYVSENCYGPDGVYAERPGWQQIADCASGAAYVMGRGQGLPGGECVLPSLPISDMSTGVLAVVGTLMALRDRATKGGSYSVHATLAAVNVYALKQEVGLYPKHIVAECQERFQWAEMRGCHHVLDLLKTVWQGWMRVMPGYLQEDSGWYSCFKRSAFQGKTVSILRPVLRFSDEEVSPEWRTGGVPYAHWAKEEVSWKERVAVRESRTSVGEERGASDESEETVTPKASPVEKGPSGFRKMLRRIFCH